MSVNTPNFAIERLPKPAGPSAVRAPGAGIRGLAACMYALACENKKWCLFPIALVLVLLLAVMLLGASELVPFIYTLS